MRRTSAAFDQLSPPSGKRNLTWPRHNLRLFLSIPPRPSCGLPVSLRSVINEQRRCCFGLLRSIVHLIAHPVTLTTSRVLARGSLETTAHKSKVRGFPEGYRVPHPPLSTYTCVNIRSSSDPPPATLRQLRDYHLDRLKSRSLRCIIVVIYICCSVSACFGMYYTLSTGSLNFHTNVAARVIIGN